MPPPETIVERAKLKYLVPSEGDRERCQKAYEAESAATPLELSEPATIIVAWIRKNREVRVWVESKELRSNCNQLRSGCWNTNEVVLSAFQEIHSAGAGVVSQDGMAVMLLQ